MAILYKLTTQDCKTRKDFSNETIWGPGVSHSGTGWGELCGPGYIHAYTDPLLAVFLNSIHANIIEPKLWLCDGEIAKTDHGLKVGCVTLTTVQEITLPRVTDAQRIKFAILCAKSVYNNTEFTSWADNWLFGTDRSAKSAEAAAWAAKAAWAAMAAKAVWAAKTAEAAWAAMAAKAAAWAAMAAEVAWAAKAAEAAEAAAWAAKAADIDLIALAREAVK